MKQPWDEFLDLYRDKLDDESHEEAVVDALVELMIRLDRAGWSDYGRRSAGLKDAADEWREEGGEDWEELRERLEERWTEWEE